MSEIDLPLYRLPEKTIKFRRNSPQSFSGFADTGQLPLARREDIVVMVLGGDGKYSCFIPTFGPSYSVTRRIEP